MRKDFLITVILCKDRLTYNEMSNWSFMTSDVVNAGGIMVVHVDNVIAIMDYGKIRSLDTRKKQW